MGTTDIMQGIRWQRREAVGTPFESAELLVWYQGTVRFALLVKRDDGVWEWEVRVKRFQVCHVDIVTVAYEGIAWVAVPNRPPGV